MMNGFFTTSKLSLVQLIDSTLCIYLYFSADLPFVFFNTVHICFLVLG